VTSTQDELLYYELCIELGLPDVTPIATQHDRNTEAVMSKSSGNVHTVPKGNGWANSVDGKVVSTHRTKENAVEKGCSIARGNESEHTIHKQNGQIGQKNSYGNDPHPPKDKR
jgi:hypothetical protein